MWRVVKDWRKTADLQAAVGKHSQSFNKNSELLFIALRWHPAFKSQQCSSDTVYTSPQRSKKGRPPVFFLESCSYSVEYEQPTFKTTWGERRTKRTRWQALRLLDEDIFTTEKKNSRDELQLWAIYPFQLLVSCYHLKAADCSSPKYSKVDSKYPSWCNWAVQTLLFGSETEMQIFFFFFLFCRLCSK